jgi:hypothetical protein
VSIRVVLAYGCDNGLYDERILVDSYELRRCENLECLIAHRGEVIALQHTHRPITTPCMRKNR